MGRKILHSQGLAQVLKNHPAIFVRIGVLPLLDGVEKIFLGILDAQFEKGKFVAARRDAEVDAVYLHIRLERHDDLFRQCTELGFDLGDERAEYRCLLLLDVHLEAQVQRLDDRSATNTQEISESLLAIEYQREHITGSICDRGYYRM